LIIEALTFKLALDFTEYLRKHRIYLADVKIDFFDRIKHEFIDFADQTAMQSYYDDNYLPVDNCNLGNLGGIQFFRATSDTYNFAITYKAVDVIGNYTLAPGASYDIQRNSQRAVLTERQQTFLNKSVAEYRKFYNELKQIYTTGIYSPCYAEPGWSENTWYLKSLREAFMDSTNQNRFPYTEVPIQKKPLIQIIPSIP